jgi:hypothetical protein
LSENKRENPSFDSGNVANRAALASFFLHYFPSFSITA